MVSAGTVHALNFIRKLAVTTVLFLAPLYFLRLGLEGWQIGVVVSLFAFAPLLASFPTGWSNDRLSIKNVIAAGLLVLAMVFSLAGFVPRFGGLALLFLVMGVANNSLDVSLNSLYFKEEKERDLNRKYGTYMFWQAMGPSVGLLVGGWFLKVGSFRVLFLVLAAAMAFSASLVRKFSSQKFSIVPLRDYRAAFFRKPVLLFAAMLFFLSLHWGVEGTVYSPFLKTRFGLSEFQLSLYIGGAYLALAASCLIIGRIPYNPALNRKLFVLGMILSGLGQILLVRTNVWPSFIFRFLHEGGDGLMGALIILYISRLFEKRSIGGSHGLLLTVQTSGHMTGALVFSTMGYKYGLQIPFIVSGVLLLANAVYSRFVLASFGKD